jgi:hypothetical protein
MGLATPVQPSEGFALGLLHVENAARGGVDRHQSNGSRFRLGDVDVQPRAQLLPVAVLLKAVPHLNQGLRPYGHLVVPDPLSTSCHCACRGSLPADLDLQRHLSGWTDTRGAPKRPPVAPVEGRRQPRPGRLLTHALQTPRQLADQPRPQVQAHLPAATRPPHLPRRRLPQRPAPSAAPGLP